MKHLGDITKINGANVEPVEVIIGGSPCQDLSIAGLRVGLGGARSGLFMEQIQIIKEMRENDRRNGRTGEFCRPRYMVWENVPGAFSSNGGEDFRIVLEETARVADNTVSIPRPAETWTPAGCIMGNGFSIAWRTFDAQYFGVAQRRKRIALVADFGGLTAPKILFERSCLSGDFEQSGESREEGQTTARSNIEKSADYAISFQERAGCAGGVKEFSYKEIESEHCQQSTINEYCTLDHHPNDSQTLNSRMGISGGNVPLIYGKKNFYEFNQTNVFSTLCAHEEKNGTDIILQEFVRRLTPLECERLQGYADGWTDIGDWTDSKGKKHKASDSVRYKALGNSIAVPCWRFILRGISQECKDKTMASLFDGIGGFPLIWEELNGSKSCRWVSEIEEFPIAVTKYRFEQE